MIPQFLQQAEKLTFNAEIANKIAKKKANLLQCYMGLFPKPGGFWDVKHFERHTSGSVFISGKITVILAKKCPKL